MGSVRVRLSIMMFLEYAIWGVWAPTLNLHLAQLDSFRGPSVSFLINMVYLTMPLATILSPFVAGQLADRYFATQRFLAVSHLIGGLFILAAFFVTSFWGMFWLILGHCLMFGPSVALTNSLAFHHLPNGEKDFGGVRLWGTIGWIAIGWAFSGWLDSVVGQQNVGQCLIFAGVLSLVMAAYCITLPNTPPAKKAESPFAFLEALKLMRKPSFAVMMGVALIVSTELQFYYVLTAGFFADSPGPSLRLKQLEAASGGDEEQAKLLMRLLDANGDDKLSKAELESYKTQIDKAAAVHEALKADPPPGGAADQERLTGEYIKAWNARTEWPLDQDYLKKTLAPADAAHLLAEVNPGAKQLTADQIGEFLGKVRPLADLQTRALVAFSNNAVDRGGLGLSKANAIRVQTIGQFVEIGVLALLPFALRKIGFTWTIGIGIIAWAVRYGMFAIGQPVWAVILSQALHGFGFGFFFAGCMVYSDRVAPKDVRASAQGLFLLATYGVGMCISSLIAGWVDDYFDHDWHKTFLVPVAILVVCALAFVIAFRPEPAAPETVPGEQPAPDGDLEPKPPPNQDVIPATPDQKYL
ncbi:MAG TPA: MFS transporter [Gemmataceae bacterium]|nr:MFS transporter [Gemmataceae bacterium]